MEPDMPEDNIVCQFCHKRFCNTRQLVGHLVKIHVSQPNLHCTYRGCTAVYKNPSSLRSHISRKHRALLPHDICNANGKNVEPNNIGHSVDNPDNEAIPESNVNNDVPCSELVGDYDDLVNNPILQPNDGDDNPFCDPNNDPDSHPMLSNNNSDPSDDPDSDPSSEYNDDDGDGDDDDDGDEYDPDNDSNPEPNDADDDGGEERNPLKHALAKYILYLRGCTRATNNDVIGILESAQELIVTYVEYYLNQVQTLLQESIRLNINDYINIEETVRSIDAIHDLNTIYNQDKYFKKNFGLVIPMRKQLGAEFQNYSSSTNDGNQRIKIKKHEMVQISISEVLSKWLSNGSYANCIQEQIRRDDDVLSSSSDGSHFQNHPFKIMRPNAKFIKLYFDEVELCDLAGSKSNFMHKLGMFYWILDDLAPAYKSQLKFINLAAIVPSPYIKKYGMNEVVSYLLTDLQEAENGVNLPNGENIYCGVSSFIGDNLACHQIGGRKGSFNCNHPCPYCMAPIDQVRTMTAEIAELLRTAAEDDRQVYEIENAPDERTKAFLRTEYGINTRCLLNDLIGFHYTESCPPDLTHDDDLGICIVTIRAFLKELCLNLESITLDEINDRIRDFDYGYSEKSAKPSKITREQLLDKKVGFKQTAAQMIMLTFMLPLIVINEVQRDWLPMKNYLLMLELILISHAHEINIPSLNYLHLIISEYLETFQTTYNETLTPKQHFLVHRCSLILKFGPLIHYKTIRMEAEHQFFKRIAQNLRTYKNLPLTLARKHQLRQTALLSESLENELKTGPIKQINLQKTAFRDLFPDENFVQTTSWVKINGIKYTASKCFIAVSYSEENLPQFRALHSIVWQNGVPIFVCQKVNTLELDLLVMAYKIEISNDFINHIFEDFLSYEVFHSHRQGNQTFIILKKALGPLY
ncbi:uncharacterized protein LOC127283851 [Leptopilina boulardi]|uniref:uncharacterized protein LOC127283851 n=1 Tax=Leptopilina boulardi TaxID=63433 RepID=UPI0021F59C7A|nr:uncharacterized protein LOC127283851 [Leptopilina boulardi]